jgi:hypothetical protein
VFETQRHRIDPRQDNPDIRPLHKMGLNGSDHPFVERPKKITNQHSCGLNPFVTDVIPVVQRNHTYEYGGDPFHHMT